MKLLKNAAKMVQFTAFTSNKTFYRRLLSKIIFVLQLLIVSFFTKAQSPIINLQWQKTLGGSWVDQLKECFQTSDGGYILGGTSSSASSGEKMDWSSTPDVWLVKLDSNRNIQWQRTMGSMTAEDEFTCMQQTIDGGYILGGASLSRGSFDYYLIKLDSNGNFQWHKYMGGYGIDFLRCLKQTSDGGFLVGGESNSQISMEKTENSRGDYDYWVVKLSDTGTILWQKTIGGSSIDDLYSIELTADGGFLLAGESGSGISGEKTEWSRGSADYWIVMLNNAGQIQWQKTLGGSSIDRGFVHAHQTRDHGYIVGGYSFSGISGDKTGASKGLTDYWIIKLDQSRAIQWQKTIGGSNSDELFAIQLTKDSLGYMIGGRSQSGISGDKTEANRGSYDYWVLKLDTSGAIQWQKTIGGSLDDQLFSIRQTSDNNFILGGESSSSISGEKTENSRGNKDYWIIKLRELPQINTIRGKVFSALNANCVQEPGENPIKNLIVQVLPGGNISQTDSNGFYKIPVDTGNLQVKVLIPEYVRFLYNQLCTDSNGLHPVYFSGYGNDTLIQSAIQIQNCPYLTVDVSSNRRRRCFRNNTEVRYCNDGIMDATNVQVHVRFPQYVKLISADKTYTLAPDGHYVFSIGNIKAGECGTIYIVDSVSCITGITGLTQCTKSWITPSNTCPLNPNTLNWDKSSLQINSSCKGDTIVRFVITNIGTPVDGDMQDSSQYRFYADGVYATGANFRLTGGDSLVLVVNANGQTIRLEANQRPGHPGGSFTSATVESCGQNSSGLTSQGFVNQQSEDDESVEVEVQCLMIRDSYDPNDKSVIPSGVSPIRLVKHKVPLDYQINFQNTGTDTAYKVVIVDTLSSFLDLSTIVWGASSHPYMVSVSGNKKPVLTFVFDNINLPDSLTNEWGSHGFVKFKITPYDTISNGTIVHNYGEIYFDFNLPVITNDAWVTINDQLPTGALLDVRVDSSAENIILPMQLLSFTAVGHGQLARLAWSTTEENGVKYFEAQRSSNGRDFNWVGNVMAAGNQLRNNYNFLDTMGTDPVYYYRLRTVDKDGGFSYSSIVSVRNPQASLVSIYPNPADDYVIIKYPASPGRSSLLLNDGTGRTLKIIAIGPTQSETKLNVDQLAAGSYYIIWKSGEMVMHKFFLVK